ncbi:MAG: putative Fe-S cluster assembly protein SufT [Pseudomonadales bacterium]
MERRLVTLNRDCEARLVPTGDPITIPADSFVTLTQSLGGAFTVIVNGNMARVDGQDADALGLEPMRLEFVPPADGKVSENQVDAALESVFDPEIPVNIKDLGLIYERRINSAGAVDIAMTLTAPGCGMGPVMVGDVERRVAQVPFVTQVSVELVFDPPWSRDMMTEEAQLELGIF